MAMHLRSVQPDSLAPGIAGCVVGAVLGVGVALVIVVGLALLSPFIAAADIKTEV